MRIGVNTAEWTSRAANAGSDFPSLAAAMLANGKTLVIASGAPTPGTAIAAEFRSPCALNPAFGRYGATRLAFPGHGVNISTILPTADGGALIAGSTSQASSNSQWLVGKLMTDGQLDPAFGHHGWALLPWRYTATTLALTHSGDIVVGGDGNANGSSFVSQITARGSLVTTFGVGGRTGMPPYHDGGVQGVWIEPNGDILSLVGGGNMGCWGVVAVTLTSSGRRIPGFTARFRRALRQVDPDPDYPITVFIGDVVVGPSGFHLVGTDQDNCVDNPPGRNPSERVSDIAFGYDGGLDTSFGTNGVTSFPAPIADSVWALPRADGSLLLATSPDRNDHGHYARADLLLYRITRTGQLETSYASHGVGDVPLPYDRDSDTALEIGSLPVSNGRQTAIVSGNAPGDAVILMEVPTR